MKSTKGGVFGQLAPNQITLVPVKYLWTHAMAIAAWYMKEVPKQVAVA